MDGHSSHYHPGTIRKAAENKVVLFILPPITTHLTQPLDKGCFGPLKSKSSELCHKYMAKNPGKVVNQFVFSELLHEAWTDAMTSLNIKARFRTTGIYPLDQNAVAEGLLRIMMFLKMNYTFFLCVVHCLKQEA